MLAITHKYCDFKHFLFLKWGEGVPLQHILTPDRAPPDSFIMFYSIFEVTGSLLWWAGYWYITTPDAMKFHILRLININTHFFVETVLDWNQPSWSIKVSIAAQKFAASNLMPAPLKVVTIECN